jgi:hypothetical protein
VIKRVSINGTSPVVHFSSRVTDEPACLPSKGRARMMRKVKGADPLNSPYELLTEAEERGQYGFVDQFER